MTATPPGPMGNADRAPSYFRVCGCGSGATGLSGAVVVGCGRQSRTRFTGPWPSSGGGSTPHPRRSRTSAAAMPAITWVAWELPVSARSPSVVVGPVGPAEPSPVVSPVVAREGVLDGACDGSVLPLAVGTAHRRHDGHDRAQRRGRRCGARGRARRPRPDHRRPGGPYRHQGHRGPCLPRRAEAAHRGDVPAGEGRRSAHTARERAGDGKIVLLDDGKLVLLVEHESAD